MVVGGARPSTPRPLYTLLIHHYVLRTGDFYIYIYLDGVRDVGGGLVVGRVAAVEAVAAPRRRRSLLSFAAGAVVLQEAPHHAVQAHRAGLRRHLLLLLRGTRDDRREPLRRRRDPQHLALEQPPQARPGWGRIDPRADPHGVSARLGQWRMRWSSVCADHLRNGDEQ
jgi:hypothetical protein